jgi:GT2 family glycosyltransferase
MGPAGILRHLWMLYQDARRRGHGRAFIRTTVRLTRSALARFAKDAHDVNAEMEALDHPAVVRLAADARALHSLLPDGDRLACSCLMLIDDPRPEILLRALASCLEQSPSALEVVVGCLRTPGAVVREVLEEAGRRRPGAVRVESLDGLGEETALRRLIEDARHPYVLIVDPEGWIRPDLLYRYDLVLRLEKDPTNVMLGCAAHVVDAAGCVTESARPRTSDQPHFPLLFDTDGLKSGVLLPADKARRWTPEPGGEPILDLVLTLSADGVAFTYVPLPLRGQPLPSRPPDRSRRARVLRRYFGGIGLDWEVRDGDGRIRPVVRGTPRVQVIVPYRDQREDTLACVRAVMAQKYQGLELTAIDNGSEDRALAALVAAEGARVLRRDEPFNFSRLNNWAARQSSAELLLFLNNDVFLAPGALDELVAWACQDCVGLVGCALFHPDGRLQHGGIERDGLAPAWEMGWEIVEYGRPRERLDRAARLRVVDAVTGACAMMRRSVFDAVGGFDETYYPNAFSDTDLSTRVRELGLRCVYTPHAEAVHVESASRRYERVEDFEGSTWLAERLGRRRGPAGR